MVPRHFAVAGAGIGGLTAALALARRGASVSVFEREPVLEPVGAGIQLSPNAMRVLEGLGLRPALEAAMVEPSAILVRRAGDGREIVRMSLEGARARWGAPYAVIHRADLQSVLFDAATRAGNIALFLGTTVETARDTGDGVALRVRRSDATVPMDADGLVVADGVWSKLRGLVADAAPPLFTGKRAWRAVVAAADLRHAVPLGVSTLWLGPDAHLVHYPVKAGTALNIVAVTSGESGQAAWSQPGLRGDLLAHFATWSEEALALLRLPERWLTWPLFRREPGGAMAKGRIALLGDAAHPMLPFLAQGGAMAIEDAAELAELFRSPATDIESGFAAYARRRAARVARVQREALANGERYHWDGVRARVRDAGLRLAGGARLLSRYDWLYGWEPHAPARSA